MKKRYGYYTVENSHLVRWGTNVSEYLKPDGTWHHYPDEWDVITNGRRIGNWLAPGDPKSGWLVPIRIDSRGTHIAGRTVSDTLPRDLRLPRKDELRFRITVEKKGPFANGCRIYGDRIGRHGKDITLTLISHPM